jgi:hypothetical protein
MMGDALEGQIADLAARLSALVVAVEELRRELAPDLASLAELLAAIYDAIGSRVFTTAELVVYAAETRNEPLQCGLVKILGPRPGRGIQRLGRFLAKRAGRSAGGFTLVLLRQGRDGNEFLVRAADAGQSPACATSVVAAGRTARYGRNSF